MSILEKTCSEFVEANVGNFCYNICPSNNSSLIVIRTCDLLYRFFFHFVPRSKSRMSVIGLSYSNAAKIGISLCNHQSTMVGSVAMLSILKIFDWIVHSNILRNSMYINIKQRSGFLPYKEDTDGYCILAASPCTTDDCVPWSPDVSVLSGTWLEYFVFLTNDSSHVSISPDWMHAQVYVGSMYSENHGQFLRSVRRLHR